MAWTDERVEKLKELWAEGCTASQIAKALGGVSRNAVIGKVHRLGLSNRAPSAKPAETDAPEPPAPDLQAPKQMEPASVKEASVDTEPSVQTKVSAAAGAASAPSAAASAAPAADPADDASTDDAAETVNPVAALAAEVERSARKLSLLELNERTCKWPIGDPSTNDFYFCGLPCAPEKPYCQAHVAVAYQPMSSRRDRDRARNRSA